jgi:hypothetical protein
MFSAHFRAYLLEIVSGALSMAASSCLLSVCLLLPLVPYYLLLHACNTLTTSLCLFLFVIVTKCPFCGTLYSYYFPFGSYWPSLSNLQTMGLLPFVLSEFSPGLYWILVFSMQFTVLATCFIMLCCLTYSLTLKMGAIHSAEMSGKFYQATQLYKAYTGWNNTNPYIHGHKSIFLLFKKLGTLTSRH